MCSKKLRVSSHVASKQASKQSCHIDVFGQQVACTGTGTSMKSAAKLQPHHSPEAHAVQGQGALDGLVCPLICLHAVSLPIWALMVLPMFAIGNRVANALGKTTPCTHADTREEFTVVKSTHLLQAMASTKRTRRKNLPSAPSLASLLGCMRAAHARAELSFHDRSWS